MDEPCTGPAGPQHRAVPAPPGSAGRPARRDEREVAAMTATATTARPTAFGSSGTAGSLVRHRTGLLLAAAVALLVLGTLLVGGGAWPGI